MESLNLFHIVYILGALKIAIGAYRFFDFVNMYISPSTLDKYLTKGAYALVTHVSEGIGKDLVTELARNGFNLILYGKDELMLSLAKIDVLNLYPSIKVLTLVQSPFKALDVAVIEILPVTVLVNNISGEYKERNKESVQELRERIYTYAFLPADLINSLLPVLTRPALLLNVLPEYGYCPAPFNSRFHNFFHKPVEGNQENLETINMIAGPLYSAVCDKPISFLRPTNEVYAKSVIAAAGSGKKILYPYWPHAVQSYLFSLLPQALVGDFLKSDFYKGLKNYN